MNLTKRIIDTVTAAYIDAVFFTDTGDTDQPTADTPLADSARDQARSDCEAFLIKCSEAGLLERMAKMPYMMTWEAVGHDLWLTRNGHGSGFWDRGIGDLGKAFTNLAQDAGGIDTLEVDGELTFA